MSRWHTLLAIDFDKWACATYAANFSGVRVECGPVADYLDMLPDADVILGGPPCQPFSDAGENEGEADERDCIPDYCAAVERVRPRMFLMENVRGLLKERHLPYFGRVLGRLEAAGYVVEWRLLDAVSYGVPQFRERVWVWGIRRDLYAAGVRHRWPLPTHAWPPPDPCMFGAALLPGVTVRQSLNLDGFGITRLAGPSSQQAIYGHVYEPDEPAPTVSGFEGGKSGLAVVPLTLYRKRGKGMIERAGERREHPVDEPSPSITAAFALGGGGGLFLKSHADQPRTVDAPGPTLRSGGNGHDGCCLRLIGDANGEAGALLEVQEAHATVPAGPRSDCGGDGGRPALRGVCAAEVPNDDGAIRKWRWSDAMLAKQPPIELDAPSPTIVRNWHKGFPYGCVKWRQDENGLWIRRLHPLECARLQSAPDDFAWLPEMPKSAAYKVVGNGWACGMAAHLSGALAEVDPDSRTVIDLFCGGGLGACGWHQRFWSYQQPEVSHA